MHRVMSGLDESISLLNEEEPLKAQLDHLARQHDAMNIPTQYFHVSKGESRGGGGRRKQDISFLIMLQVFNEGLLMAVHATVGRCFDETAWSSCLQVIEDGIVAHRGDS